MSAMGTPKDPNKVVQVEMSAFTAVSLWGMFRFLHTDAEIPSVLAGVQVVGVMHALEKALDALDMEGWQEHKAKWKAAPRTGDADA